jgi:hypothetical protein
MSAEYVTDEGIRFRWYNDWVYIESSSTPKKFAKIGMPMESLVDLFKVYLLINDKFVRFIMKDEKISLRPNKSGRKVLILNPRDIKTVINLLKIDKL